MKITSKQYKEEYGYCVWLDGQFPDFEYGSIFIKDKWNVKKQNYDRIYSVMGWSQKINRNDDPALPTILDSIDRILPYPIH
jgi:hypothetical protein